jgi:beta-lactamase superfamily II metal-dependent hydrolase
MTQTTQVKVEVETTDEQGQMTWKGNNRKMRVSIERGRVA